MPVVTRDVDPFVDMGVQVINPRRQLEVFAKPWALPNQPVIELAALCGFRGVLRGLFGGEHLGQIVRQRLAPCFRLALQPDVQFIG